jgi:trk system potassium uptake protein
LNATPTSADPLDVRPVLLIVGVVLSILAVGMLVPALVDAIAGYAEWRAFAVSSAITLFVGALLYLTGRHERIELTIRQTFILTTANWVIVAAFGAIPFMISPLQLGFADAYFESMSGITTTGGTVIVGLDQLSPGILLWRGLLNWLGGIGIIVLAVAILPLLKIGGMQLFRTESSDRSDKVLPRVTQIANALILAYVGLSAACALCFYAAGMTPLEAVVHAMASVATGGFSTSDNSFGKFDSPAIELIGVLFMFLGSLTFTLYVRAWQARSMRPLWRDRQVQFFFHLLLGTSTGIALWLWWSGQYDLTTACVKALFNVVSIATTTGFASADFTQWGGLPVTIFFFLLVVGGCTGSTTGGVKMFRFQVLIAASTRELKRLFRPSQVLVITANERPVSEEVLTSILGFLALYGATILMIAVLLGATGLDLVTAVTGAMQAVGNVGPGLGDVIGPAGNYSTLPDAAIWALSLGMLLGRLELMTLIVLFVPSFWRE